MIELPDKGANRPDPMAFGRAIPAGLGLNLLVADVDLAARFQVAVLGSRIDYWEEHFAVINLLGASIQLHSDWSYRNHELGRAVVEAGARGVGAELRLYGLNPDECVERARAYGAYVLSAALDKPHGLREAHILDPDGYIWAPSAPLSD